jgi:hypothetical protein
VVGAGFSLLALSLAVINQINYHLSWKVLEGYSDICIVFFSENMHCSLYKGTKGIEEVRKRDSNCSENYFFKGENLCMLEILTFCFTKLCVFCKE